MRTPPLHQLFLTSSLAFTLAIGSLLGATGCSVPEDERINCEGKSYSTYLSEVIAAKLTYEKRCGLLPQDGSRDTQRRSLLAQENPTYLTDARDRSYMDKRSAWDPSCMVNGLKDAACTPGTYETLGKSCKGKENKGCLLVGRTCLLPEECGKGYCKGISEGTLCGSGVCAERSAIGVACPEGNTACDPQKGYCRNSVCYALEAAGATCQQSSDCADGNSCIRSKVGDASGKCGKPTLGQAGDPCDRVEDLGKLCAANLSCYRDNAATYRCQTIKQNGQECSTSEACAYPLSCVKAKVTDPSGVCKPLGALSAECNIELGQACQLTLNCFSFDPMQPAACQGQPENGQRCVPMQLSCLTGICDTTQNPARCQPKAPTGQACQNHGDCVSGICDPMTRKCQTPSCR